MISQGFNKNNSNAEFKAGSKKKTMNEKTYKKIVGFLEGGPTKALGDTQVSRLTAQLITAVLLGSLHSMRKQICFVLGRRLHINETHLISGKKQNCKSSSEPTSLKQKSSKKKKKLSFKKTLPTRFHKLISNKRNRNIPSSKILLFRLAEDGTGDDSHSADMENLIRLLSKESIKPCGYSALACHIRAIHKEVSKTMPSRLLDSHSDNKKLVCVIAPKGLPLNETEREEFIDSLRLLKTLPMSVVVRLHPEDAEKTVPFYNDLASSEMDLPLQVLVDVEDPTSLDDVECDDPWLLYALPIHRLREMGFHDDRFLDAMDEESLLSQTEVQIFCSCSSLFGEEVLFDDLCLEEEPLLINNQATPKKNPQEMHTTCISRGVTGRPSTTQAHPKGFYFGKKYGSSCAVSRAKIHEMN